jgi:hypothetical protein
MSTLGIARMSRLKSAEDVSLNDSGMSSTSKWVADDRAKPNLAAKVLVVYDNEYNYSAPVPLDFDHTNRRAIRAQLRLCFSERLFTRECDVPCILYVYEHGELVYKTPFILHHRMTSRHARNDFSLKVTTQEWHRVKSAPVPQRYAFIRRATATIY